MYCSQCGVEITGNFCGYCGTRVRNLAQVKVENPYKGKNKQIVGVLLAIVGIILFFSSVSQDSSRLGTAIGCICSVAGLITAMVGKFEHWYHAE